MALLSKKAQEQVRRRNFRNVVKRSLILLAIHGKHTACL